MSKLRVAVVICLMTVFMVHGLPSFAQDFYIQGSNETRWADGREELGGQDVVKRYFEDRLNLNMYYGNVRVGTRFTMLQPSEFGQYQTDVNTLEKRFIEYSDPDANINLRIGNFYSVWGRGLGLALVEDILQGFDSGLDGMQAKVGAGDFEVEGLSGRSRAGYLGDVREARVSAGQVAYFGPWNTNFGAQGMLVTPVEDDILSYQDSRTWAGHAAWDGSSVSLWTEYAREDIEAIKKTHDAFYASGSWYAGRFSLFADYKRYRYYVYPGGTETAGSTYDASIDILPFHSPPIVQREFTSPLFSKHPHIVRFDDEVGFQIEGSYNISGANTIALNFSQSSSFVEDELYIPSLDEENSPYRQVFAEFTGYPTMDWYLTAWAGWDEELNYTTDVLPSGRIVAERTRWVRRIVAGAGSEYQLADDWSMKVQLDGATVEDLVFDDTSFESITILGATWKQQYSLSLVYETAENDPNQPDKTSWIKGEFAAFVANRHELLLTIGEERGGLVCTSGKCRVVAPFDGVKLTFTSIF